MKYRSYFFAQEHEADQWLELFKANPTADFLDALADHDLLTEYQDCGHEPPWGDKDSLYYQPDHDCVGTWVVSVNWMIPYIGVAMEMPEDAE